MRADLLELTRDPDEPSEWQLRGDGTPLARVALPATPSDGIAVAPADAPAWRLEAYGRGWRLVGRREDDGEPLLWYTGHRVRSGGELVVAPERRLDVHSHPLKRLDWSVDDERGERLVDAVAHPAGDGCRVEVRVAGAGASDPDGELVATFVAVLGLLVWREGSAQRAFGYDVGPV